MTLPRRIRAAALMLAASAALIAPTAIVPAAAAPAGCLGNPSDTWLNVSVEGLRNGNGLLTIALYPDDTIALNRRAMHEDKMLFELQRRLRQMTNKNGFIDADTKVEYCRVVDMVENKSEATIFDYPK